MHAQVDRLKAANGELCAEINRQEKRISELEAREQRQLMDAETIRGQQEHIARLEGELSESQGACEGLADENVALRGLARDMWECFYEKPYMERSRERFKQRMAALGLGVDWWANSLVARCAATPSRR